MEEVRDVDMLMLECSPAAAGEATGGANLAEAEDMDVDELPLLNLDLDFRPGSGAACESSGDSPDASAAKLVQSAADWNVCKAKRKQG